MYRNFVNNIFNWKLQIIIKAHLFKYRKKYEKESSVRIMVLFVESSQIVKETKAKAFYPICSTNVGSYRDSSKISELSGERIVKSFLKFQAYQDMNQKFDIKRSIVIQFI